MLNAMLKASFFVAALATFTSGFGCNSDGSFAPEKAEKIVVATTQVAGEVRPVAETVVAVTPPGSVIHEIAMGVAAIASIAIAFEQSSRRAKAGRKRDEFAEKSIELAKQVPAPGQVVVTPVQPATENKGST